MAQVAFYNPSEQEAEIKRRRLMAQQLGEIGKDTGNEVVGGIVVNKSPLEGLVKGLSTGLGSYQNARANTEERDLAGNRQKFLAEALEKAGTDPRAAATSLLQDPATQDIGVKLYADALSRDKQDKTMAYEMYKDNRSFDQKERELNMKYTDSDVSPGISLSPLTHAQMMTESSGNPNAVSPAGARGLMQLMPGTQTNPGFGVRPAADSSPQENLRVGQDYQAALTSKYGDQNLGLMAYNWGPGNVDKWLASGADPSKVPQETQQYVSKINNQLGGSYAMETPANQQNNVIANSMTPHHPQQPTNSVQGPNGQQGQFLYQGRERKPYTEGLEKGLQWAQDESGNRFAAPIPGFMTEDKIKARENAPLALQQGKNALTLVDQLINHPGLNTSVGAKGPTGGLMFGKVIPGTEAADFNALLDQVKGGTFLEAYKNMRGTGAISNNEGVRAENAIARLQTAQSEPAFKQALMEYKQIIQQGIERQKQVLGQSGQSDPNNDPLGLR